MEPDFHILRYLHFLHKHAPANVAIGTLTVTPERQEVVDFSTPWLDYGRDVLLAKDVIERDIFFFIKPFK